MKKIIGFLAICFLGSCTTTHVTSSWVKAGDTHGHYSNIMVIALVNQTDNSLQQKVEEDLVSRLKRKGYNASSFFDEYGPKAALSKETDEKEAVARLRKNGADAILTVVLLDTAKEHNYVQGDMGYPYGAYYTHFWGYYTSEYNRVYAPGYYGVTDTKYFWETSLYNSSNQELVYSVQTESFDPGSSKSMAEQYARVIVDNMEKKEVLAKK